MFTGFSDETVEFMWGIRLNNEKPWFEAHKQEYLTHLYQPMRALGEEIYDHIAEKLPDYGLICKVCRIYRDARRLHGQGPYKDHLWLTVQQPSDAWTAAPCFWFELRPEGWSYGLGYYTIEPVTMAKLRARMDADPKKMETLTRKLNKQTEFVLEGVEYKRPKSAAPSTVLEPWYRFKNFSLSHDEPFIDELFDRRIVDRIMQGYDFLLPYYQYFVTLDGDPDPRGE